MFHKFEEGKEAIINEVVERIHTSTMGKQAPLFATFIRQFYGTMSLSELRLWSIDDLYGLAINFWALIYEREPAETKVRIYNPNYEQHGWKTTHTVVEVICNDAPFLVDSLRLAIYRKGLSPHLTIHMGGFRIKRDEKNHISEIFPQFGELHKTHVLTEAPIFMEIDRQTKQADLDALRTALESVLEDNHIVVADWEKMREKVREVITELESPPPNIDANELAETKAFLHWLEDHHFTFLGVRDYELSRKGTETIIKAVPDTGLGLLRDSLSPASTRVISAMTPEAHELTDTSRMLVMSKLHHLATVHRDAYTDYIGIKRFDKNGKLIGERRIIGLYTSAAYNTNPKHIPFLRRKLALVMEKSRYNPRSHAGKTLEHILQTLPRNDLIQANEEELLEIALGIFHLQDRRQIRMFPRMDVYGRFISCLVYVPKDQLNTKLILAMQNILKQNFHAKEITFTTHFSDFMLARVHYMIYVDPQDVYDYDMESIEKELVQVGRSWTDDLQHYLNETFGEEHGNTLYTRYKDAFPLSYTDNYPPQTAVYDIKHIETLSETNPLALNFYKMLDEPESSYRLKIYQHDNTIPLSDVLPILENLGLRAISESPFDLTLQDGKTTWVNDFAMQYTHDCHFDLDHIRDIFQNAFAKVWFGEMDNDGFNQLILAAGFNWQEVTVLRTYAKYFKQIRFTFSQDYIEGALNHNTNIAKKLIELFEIRFNPSSNPIRTLQFDAKIAEIYNDLEDVSNLDEDKIIRQYVQVISHTFRTNFYQRDATGKIKKYLSFKLQSSGIPGVPKPIPMAEIFVYSPRFEGVHLRCGKVARGGIRWSDRREDFRIEILGLMKAQHVKNAIIVPSGAKGGFITKHLSANATREEIQAEGVHCYQEFIRGLLDITDNYQDGSVVKPLEVICYDDDDPYLVVAADKGTASFSDIANAISCEYNFWLGDAFASGGSLGYDHKKMGITAKGAWESVKRHFYELNMDIERHDFTVVGIGDMSGDVFGNGMILSNHIKLIGAFNHIHIFVDPHPLPKPSLKERIRLFNLPRSTWMDYDRKLISNGGGVFARSAKSIPISKEMKQVLNISAPSLEPNELIRVLLKADVDLLWSGGIGTYIKATAESNADVGDKINDAARVNAADLHCKVIAEGGNLGVSQMGRIEYAMHGGLNYPDFIDNSGGVSCSDKEVNIKILLDGMVNAGDLTRKQRNVLLGEMTDEVAQLVLRDNFLQTRAISLTAAQAPRMLELHIRYLNELEKAGKIDRALEFLPDDKTIMDRKLAGTGLARPGISVLLSYSKIILKENILASDVPENAYLKDMVVTYFPKPLQKRFSAQIQTHPLRREIIATKLSNIIINEMGFTFVYRLQDETGASVASIVKAYMITRSVLNLDASLKQLEALGTRISADKQEEIMILYIRLCRRITRWFLRTQRMSLDISKAVERYAPGVVELTNALPSILGAGSRALYESHLQAYLADGIPEALSHNLSATPSLFAAMDIIEVTYQSGMSIPEVAQVYFAIGEFLNLSWIRAQILVHPTENHWEALSREALRDDLDWQQRQLAGAIIAQSENKKDFMRNFDAWSEKYASLITRWKRILDELQSSSTLNYTMFFVATRELLDLTQTTAQLAKET